MESLSRFNLIGSSPQFQKVVGRIHSLARLDATVLVNGETGTGKELAVRAIHYLSARSDRPFVPVNCGALSESLVESELFGHERGAFTDAKNASAGLIGEAAGGTLFLDEVDALSPRAQAALLRFLQDRTYRRVGGGALRQVDVRVAVASNADLKGLAEARLFRKDLLYRLNVITLHMPPLREREGDAEVLARAMLQRFSHQYRLPPKRLHAEGLAFIERYAWPGNVRELENVMHREFLMCEDSELRLGESRAELMPAPAQAPRNESKGELPAFREAKARAVAEFERDYVCALLSRTQGNISHAARLARQDRSAFGKLVRKYGVGSEDGGTAVWSG
ncbi:sigma-54-dependent Fis family transcriptional regulator [Pseudothauera nasutitermitis]|uniref:Sigma-54-dependent Fis family transcriptional regulator n=1 Tax=Pseudothauera nasutitermitis TaxID=2565930 RepID=A0A4S4AV63_9RHOO|nr:sigma-54 dependent transcriptional regulator [Pseudothauera nasutitermitis]THF63714.1 sigma-54-dependent Fis family transcriptional regulator [Pseudothauera nasutitermitis]